MKGTGETSSMLSLLVGFGASVGDGTGLEGANAANLGDRTRTDGEPNGEASRSRVDVGLYGLGGDKTKGDGPTQLSAYPESIESSRWIEPSNSYGGKGIGGPQDRSTGERRSNECLLLWVTC